MIKESTYELSLEIKPSHIIFTVAMIIALLKMASPAQFDTGFKNSVDNLNYLITYFVIKDEDGFYESKN